MFLVFKYHEVTKAEDNESKRKARQKNVFNCVRL